jgi:hypothetical protein
MEKGYIDFDDDHCAGDTARADGADCVRSIAGIIIVVITLLLL